MQRLVLASIAAVAALAAAPMVLLGQGAASAPAPVKIAFISSQEILRATPGYAAAESTYRKELQASQTEVQKLSQQVDSAQQVFDLQQLALSPAARAAKLKELQTMGQRVEQRSNELSDRLRQREQDLLGPLRERINSVIQGIRAEMNYSLILDADAAQGFVAAADPTLNITARVLQRLSRAQ
ncbi:MAG TPA: OmpH family outer membrane protein [Gemmatimonadales bacterium]|jgi:outer membrane protein